LGIWTKKDAPFICIEPWLGIADNANTSGKIEEKEGIQILENNSKNRLLGL
jgi:galactose mutarotase-like enzyme